MKKIWKQTLAVLLSVLLLVSAAPSGALADMLSVTAAAETYGGNCSANVTWSLDTSAGVLSIAGTGVIPYYSSGGAPWYPYRASVQTVTIGSGVISIGNYAFQDCTSLTNITIGQDVDFIGNYAFAGCTSLAAVTIPDSVECINSFVFQGCTSLTSIIIPDSVENLGTYVFSGCTNLLHATVGNGVTSSIGSRAFQNCTNLASVTIGNSVTGIDKLAFENCVSLTGITIPDSVTSIDWQAFQNCTGLVSVTIGSGVTSIGNRAFYQCSSLSAVTIPNNVTEIGDYAFYECEGLTNATIGSGLTSIPQYAFYGCTGLETLTIGNHVTSIGAYAFENCDSLLSVSIPDSVTDIGMRAFGYCDDLASVTIGNGATAIPEFAFCACSSLANLTIGSHVTSIGRGAFLDCASLLNVTVPSGVTSIDAFAFSGCTHLASVSIPDSVTSMGGNVFQDCKSLTSVVLPAYLTSIGGQMFDNCENLTSVTIPSGVTSIGNSAFKACKSMTAITIPDTVTSIDSSAFGACMLLRHVTIPSGVTSIAPGLFSGCKALESVTIPSGVTSIGNNAFWGCDALTDITIPSGVTSIEPYAFYGCSGLAGVTIPDGVTSIGSYAFYSCTGFTSIAIPNNVTSIGSNAFLNCFTLTDVTVGGNVTTISGNAFANCVSIKRVFYNGTQAQWEDIDVGAGNDRLLNATIHYLGNSQHAHTFTSELTSPGTCTTDGMMTFTCVCGITVTEPVPSLGGHHYNSVVTAPTCRAGGYTTYTCSECGDTYTDDYTPAIAHAFTDWHVLIAPTVNSAGMEIRNCTVCGYVERTLLDPLPTGYGYFHGGDGTAENPLLIADGEDFDHIDDFFAEYGDNLPCSPVHFLQIGAISMNDLTYTGADPDDPYAAAYPLLQNYTQTPASVMHDAVYDGGGHDIILTGSILSSDYAGLFGLATNCTIRNFRVWMSTSTVLSTSANGCAGIVARAENCVFDTILVRMWGSSSFASWTNSANVGVLAGCTVNCSVQNCAVQTVKGRYSFIGGATSDFTARNTWWTMTASGTSDYSPQYVRNVNCVAFVHDGLDTILSINDQQLEIPNHAALVDAQGAVQRKPLQFDPTATGQLYDLYLSDYVTFTAGEHGSLTGESSVILYGEYEATESVSGIAPVPDPGYVFAGWSITSQGDDQSSGQINRRMTQQADGTYTYSTYMTYGLGTATVTANFEPLPAGYGFFSGGYGTEDSPFLISTAADFDHIDDFYTAYGDNLPSNPVYFTQTADISLESLPSYSETHNDAYAQAYWFFEHRITTPVSVMQDAVYDGGGHQIDMASVVDGGYAGVFGLVTNSTIRNLRAYGESLAVMSTAENGCAGVIARAENCLLDMIRIRLWSDAGFESQTGSASVGILAGSVENCCVQNCLTQTAAGRLCFIGGTTQDFTSRNTWWTMDADTFEGYSAQYVRNVTGVVFTHENLGCTLEVNNSQIVIPEYMALVDAEGNLQPEPLPFDPTATGLRYHMYFADHVTFTAGEHGSLTGEGSTVLYGEHQETKTVTGLQPIPDTGYVFTGWDIAEQFDSASQGFEGDTDRRMTLQADGTYTYSTVLEYNIGTAAVTATFAPHEAHTFGDWTVTTEPTCISTGERTRTCTDCGFAESETIPTTAHSYDAVVTAPTCTEDGFTTYICSGCGDTYTADETDALDHSFGAWIVTTPATTESAGVETRTCERCLATETRAIPVIPAGYGFFSGGYGTETSPFLISTAADFDHIDDFYTAYGDNLPCSPVYFTQTAHLDLSVPPLPEYTVPDPSVLNNGFDDYSSGYSYYAVTPVSVMHDAVYDGGGFEIFSAMGMTCFVGDDYAGVFGHVTNSTIRNVRVFLEGVTFLSTAANGCAGVVAHAENCLLDTIRVRLWGDARFASLTNSVNVGALAGYAEDCRVQNCLAQISGQEIGFIGGAAADFTSSNTWWVTDEYDAYNLQSCPANVTGTIFVHEGYCGVTLEINNGQIVIPNFTVLTDAEGNLQPEPLQYDPAATGLQYHLYYADHVTFAAGEHGSLMGESSVILYGEPFETKTLTGLQPIPDTGYVFSDWSISVSGNPYGNEGDRSLTLQSDGAYTYATVLGWYIGNAVVTANFAPHETHTFGGWAVTTAPTCISTGEKTHTCTVCGYTESETIPVLQPAVLIVNTPTETIYTGDTVQVTVDLAQNPGLIGMQLGLVYNADALTLTDVQTAGMFTTGECMPGHNLAAQPYGVVWFDALTLENHTETGNILIFTFTVNETAQPGEISFGLTYDPESTFNFAEQDVPLQVTGAQVTVVRHLPGDSDSDGELDLADVATLLRYLAGGWEGITVDVRNADVNADGVVNLKDAVLLRRYLAGWDVTLQ